MLFSRELVPVPLLAPDFQICDVVYGSQLSATDCYLAGDSQLPQGANGLPYYVDDPSKTYHIPFTVSHG